MRLTYTMKGSVSKAREIARKNKALEHKNKVKVKEPLISGMGIPELTNFFNNAPMENIVVLLKSIPTQQEQLAALQLVPKSKLAQLKKLL